MIPVALGLLFALLAIGIPIGAMMLILALALDFGFSPMPLYRAVGELSWTSSSNYLLVCVPLFILLGEILLRAGIAERLYQAIMQWIGWLPGGLMHANIGASMAFAATSGSSVATAATISVVAKPMIGRYGYSERLFYGSVAAGGTLGILVPPSINLVLYGWLTSTSVPALYMAGILPGIVLAGLFSASILIICLLRPSFGGYKIETSWQSRIASLPSLLPPLFIFAVIIGSIYLGIATPTESASLGVLAALVLAALYRQLTLRMVMEAVDGTMRTTGMIMLIVMAAWFLNFVISAMGLVAAINSAIASMGLSPLGLLLSIIAIYVVLGCFMDPLPMMIVTVPVLTPLVVAAGYDPIWFGILIVMLCETALITPPIGMILFVVQGVRRRGSITDLMIGVMPFLVSLIVIIAIVLLFPKAVLWLPSLLN
ncbi:TRAP transporter large permease [Pararhizobium mangrovi]|uniref:TRAP transporter large permease protein n=1 Tax=Pararhizobium mangrovi TaxID=2590452 RepID=A0A506U7R9_9HYPH|nr:TRAP transporter large permease [Pararhizobium mangrovi]TPW27937.1 TRAP transporter large permease [Pararhizobium mangrovi]